MATTTVQAPPLREYPVIPILAPDAMAASKPYAATEKMNEALGFPGKLVDGWQAKAIGKMGELLDRNRGLRVFLDACVHCGACTDKCHYFLGTGDPKNMPVARQDLFRKVYRRHFTLGGKLFPKLVGAEDLTESVLDDWYRYFNQCSECRRCSVYCPYGIDTAEITMAAKEVMDSIGVGQKYTNEIIGKVHKIGNNLGLPGPALKDTLESLEEDVKEETGLDVRFPLDEKGAEVLLVTPSADFFAEPHVYSLMGYAKVFHAAGIRWTLSSHASEAANFGVFIGSQDQMKSIAGRVRAGGARPGRETHRGGRVRPRLARRLQLLEHADRPVRFPRRALPGAAAHLRADLRPDPARRGRRSTARSQRRARGHFPRFLQRRARLRAWAASRAGNSSFRARSSAPPATVSTTWRRRRSTSTPSAAAAAAACSPTSCSTCA